MVDRHRCILFDVAELLCQSHPEFPMVIRCWPTLFWVGGTVSIEDNHAVHCSNLDHIIKNGLQKRAALTADLVWCTPLAKHIQPTHAVVVVLGIFT